MSPNESCVFLFDDPSLWKLGNAPSPHTAEFTHDSRTYRSLALGNKLVQVYTVLPQGNARSKRRANPVVSKTGPEPLSAVSGTRAPVRKLNAAVIGGW